MNMIEKVARAIAQAMMESPHYDCGGRSISQEVDLLNASYMPAAKAAIEAMRDELMMTKALEWNDDPCPAAECAFGHYVINERYAHVELLIGYGRSMMTSLCRLQLERGASLHDLKATAQTDYQERIDAALASK